MAILIEPDDLPGGAESWWPEAMLAVAAYKADTRDRKLDGLQLKKGRERWRKYYERNKTRINAEQKLRKQNDPKARARLAAKAKRYYEKVKNTPEYKAKEAARRERRKLKRSLDSDAGKVLDVPSPGSP